MACLSPSQTAFVFQLTIAFHLQKKQLIIALNVRGQNVSRIQLMAVPDQFVDLA